jgi:GntR family transcriptional regulator of arabinose operon
MMSIPKYMDIVKWTTQQITAGTVQPGKKFHSENTLCKMFDVSRQTVRRALEELELMGHVTRVKGSGTYISEKQPTTPSRPIAKYPLSKSVGIITTYLDAYIFPSIIQGIETVLTDNGFTVQLTSTKNLVEGELRALQMMSENNLDGLIIWPTKSGLPCMNQSFYQALYQKGLPIVFVDSYYTECPGTYVALDDEGAGKVATQHLLEMGHQEIAGIFPHSDQQGYLRYKGYIKAFTELGLPIREEYIHWYSKDNVQELLASPKLWETLSSCTAAFCFNDSLALMLIDSLRQKSIRVPEDFSVVGVDNTLMARMGALTSVIHPAENLGESVANLLIAMINGEEGQNILFPAQLVIRDSVRKIEMEMEIK